MANNFHADILYDYLVEGFSQQDIADRYGEEQSEISRIIREEYGLNRGNVKWGKGANNQRGKYSFLTYDDICAFIDSGSMDIDDWLGGNNGQNDYTEEYDNGYEDNYDNSYNNYNNNYSDTYNQSYNNNSQYRGTKRKVTYVNPDDYDDNGNYRGSKGSADGRLVLLGLGVIILFLGWLVSKIGNNGGILGQSIQILWHSDYLWWGVATGGIFGFIKYQSCKSLGEVFTTCGTWAWTGLGYVVGAVLFFLNYGLFLPALMLGLLGAIIFLIGYKLFY
ncbi:MAG: hypothetical protein E7419_00585 [Ruminococcaceae bacterium]|nr:hypothetical protein [Oscillospiraceae bacterium]